MARRGRGGRGDGGDDGALRHMLPSIHCPYTCWPCSSLSLVHIVRPHTSHARTALAHNAPLSHIHAALLLRSACPCIDCLTRATLAHNALAVTALAQTARVGNASCSYCSCYHCWRMCTSAQVDRVMLAALLWVDKRNHQAQAKRILCTAPPRRWARTWR